MSDAAFEIKDYRQPLVTSLGVILGFMLGFLGQWVIEPNFALKDTSDHITFWGSVVSAGLMLMALFRMLQPLVDPAQGLVHYQRTLRLYMPAVVLAFSVIVSGVFL
jgi:hypothetical protein